MTMHNAKPLNDLFTDFGNESFKLFVICSNVYENCTLGPVAQNLNAQLSYQSVNSDPNKMNIEKQFCYKTYAYYSGLHICLQSTHILKGKQLSHTNSLIQKLTAVSLTGCLSFEQPDQGSKIALITCSHTETKLVLFIKYLHLNLIKL